MKVKTKESKTPTLDPVKVDLACKRLGSIRRNEWKVLRVIQRHGLCHEADVVAKSHLYESQTYLSISILKKMDMVKTMKDGRFVLIAANNARIQRINEICSQLIG